MNLADHYTFRALRDRLEKEMFDSSDPLLKANRLAEIVLIDGLKQNATEVEGLKNELEDMEAACKEIESEQEYERKYYDSKEVNLQNEILQLKAEIEDMRKECNGLEAELGGTDW